VPVCRCANPEPYWLIIRLRRCLATWALAAARGVPVRKVLRQRGWSKSTFYRKLDGGAARIAAILGRARRRGAVIGGRVRPEQRPELLAGGRRQGVSGEKYFWPSSKHAIIGTLMQVPDLGS